LGKGAIIQLKSGFGRALVFISMPYVIAKTYVFNIMQILGIFGDAPIL